MPPHQDEGGHAGRRTAGRDRSRETPARTERSSRRQVDRQAARLDFFELAAYGALFFLVALVFDTSLEVQFTLPKLLIVRLATPVLAALWVVRFVRGEVRPVPSYIVIAAAFYAGWLIVTTVFAVHQPTALHGAHGRYNGLWNQAIWLLLFLIVASSAFDVTR